MASRQKAHIGLNVRNVDRSAKFYRAMFGIEPVKWKPGYAKFDIDEPPLNLTLNYSDNITDQGALNHLGVEVESTAAVLAAKERFQKKAGLATLDEMNVNCCLRCKTRSGSPIPTATAGKSLRSRSATRNPNSRFLRSSPKLPNAQHAARRLFLNDH